MALIVGKEGAKRPLLYHSYVTQSSFPLLASQLGNQRLTNNLNGNLTSDGTNSYVWDARNRLAAVTGSGVSASFQYDTRGRRVSKTISGTTTSFLYDAANTTQEQSAQLGNANILGGGVDEIFTRTDSTGTWSPFVDGLGSSLSLTDATGTAQTEYAYGAFGQPATTGSSSTNSSQYTGRENDGTGLQYNRARYYSPALQRFISEDPMGFGGGDINLYAYAANSPTNFTDPSGLEISEIRSHISGPILGGRKDPDCGCSAGSGPKFPDNFDWWGAFWQEYWKRRNQSCHDNGGFDNGSGTCMPLPMVGCGLSVVPGAGGAGFLGQESGPAIPVPEGASGPIPTRGPGVQYTGGGGGNGLNPSVSSVRVMDPTVPRGPSPGYPNGYASYGNAAGQTVNPYTGQPVSRTNPWWHLPLGPR